MFLKLVCRSLTRTAMIKNIAFPVQTNFTIHAPYLRGVQLTPITLYRPHQHQQSKTFCSHVFLESTHLILKRIYWSTSPPILTALSFFKLSGQNVEVITSTNHLFVLKSLADVYLSKRKCLYCFLFFFTMKSYSIQLIGQNYGQNCGQIH